MDSGATINIALNHFYDSLATESDLQALVAERREEDLHLEFKQKVDSRNGNLDLIDKENFSVAMSAFANADGGILIFGIKTVKSADGIDRAKSRKPITGHDLLCGRLIDSILNTTQPVVDDVRIDTIAAGPTAGYVKCLIPQSSKPPHRAMSNNQYWRRASSGNRRMEHYELEDMFGRRLRPSLRLRLELKLRPGEDPHEELYFYMLNEGRGLGRHVGFLCKPTNVVIAGVSGFGLQNSTHINAGSPTISFYDSQSVVHSNGIYTAMGHAILRRDTKGSPLHAEIIWYAENMDTRRASVDVLPNQTYLLP